MERKYKGIEFAKGYNRSFADFKKEFGHTHVFKGMLPEQKEAELKKAHQIATKGNGPVRSKTTGSKKNPDIPKDKG
jgi:hypothetical protein